MYNNPYAQAGWNPENARSNSHRRTLDDPSQSRILGALPYPTYPDPPASSRYLTFTFRPSSRDIMQSTILGPSGQTYFEVVTCQSRNVSSTIISKADSQVIAVIEWREHPTVEVIGVLAKQKISQWLRLSSDRSSRTIEARGNRATWIPSGNHIYLYPGSLPAKSHFAKISRHEEIVILEISTDSVNAGLLEAVIVSAMLLQCGRNID